MAEDSFKVSVYIPAYNAAALLPLCIEHLLKQTCKPDEIIVVDDGSTDPTLHEACRYPVKIVRHQTNLGLAVARNSGVRAAKYDLVGALDADTIPHEKWLENLLFYFQYPSVGMASGMLVETYDKTLSDLWRATHMQQHFGKQSVKNPPFIFGNNTVVRKSIVEEVGWYTERLRTNFEDADFSFRVRARGYDTIYDPQAAVAHLRQDTLKSILVTSWKWKCYAYQHPVTFKNNFTVMYHKHWKCSFQFIKEDFKSKTYRLIFLDILHFLASVYFDFKMWFRVRFLGKKAY